MLIQAFKIVSLMMVAACSVSLPQQVNFQTPTKVCELPAELFEISGLTDMDETSVACVQDELGKIFFYDLNECAVTSSVSFEDPGDFEGLTRVGNDFYALRSDGALYEIVLHQKEKPKVVKINTKIPAGDNEGLGYDEKKNQLLLAPKGKYHDKDYGKNYRAIYAYDIEQGKMLDEPVLQIPFEAVQKLLRQTKGVDLPTKKGSAEIKFKFDVSSITAHPVKDLYYILISSEKLVLIVDGNSNPIEILPLDDKLFPKPEGITFLSPDILAISSEGDKSNPVIALFNL